MKKENSKQGKKIKTYSKRMKSFSKINTFYFVLKTEKEKKGGLQKIKIRTWLIQNIFKLQLSTSLNIHSTLSLRPGTLAFLVRVR